MIATKAPNEMQRHGKDNALHRALLESILEKHTDSERKGRSSVSRIFNSFFGASQKTKNPLIRAK